MSLPNRVSGTAPWAWTGRTYERGNTMIDKMVGGAINALVGALKVVVLFGILVGLVVWAKADPDSWKALMAQVAGALVSIVSWVCRLIVDLIPKS